MKPQQKKSDDAPDQPQDQLANVTSEIARIAATPPAQRSAEQNTRLQELERERQRISGAQRVPGTPSATNQVPRTNPQERE